MTRIIANLIQLIALTLREPNRVQARRQEIMQQLFIQHDRWEAERAAAAMADAATTTNQTVGDGVAVEVGCGPWLGIVDVVTDGGGEDGENLTRGVEDLGAVGELVVGDGVPGVFGEERNHGFVGALGGAEGEGGLLGVLVSERKR